MLFCIKKSLFYPYYFLIRKWKRVFERELLNLESIDDIERQLTRANELARTATYYPNGYLCSARLENVYLKAASLVNDCPCEAEAKTVLHVMTQAYRTGGHTRVVERWINHSSDSEHHSVVILSQGNEECPEWLISAAERTGGQVYFISNNTILEKAKQLRELASHYERIVLHTHMYDGTPIVAFGTPGFATPIILFNHADHLFWLGSSVADVVADIKQDTITLERRLSYGFYLGIPPEQSHISAGGLYKKEEIRLELGLDADSFVCITTATAFKLEPAGIIDFRKSIVKIANTLNVTCVVIGPSIKDDRWRKAVELSTGKVIPVGEIKDKSLYHKYLSAADCYIGSFPFMSYTAMMDAVSFGLPLLQYRFLRQDGIRDILPEKSEMICHSVKELIAKICNLKNDNSYRNQLIQISNAWLQNMSSVDGWKGRLSKLYSSLPERHRLNYIENVVGKDVRIDDAAVLNAFSYSHSPGSGLYYHKILNNISEILMRVNSFFLHN